MKKWIFIIVCILGNVCLLSWESRAEEFCVGTTLEFTDALEQAEANGESDVLMVQQGTYVGSFSFNSVEDTNIAVRGGYETGCTGRVIDPRNTVIDAAASGSPLSITKNSDGNVAVEGLTMQNGGYRGFYIRLHNDSGGNVGSIEVKNNIVTNNKPKGGIYIASENNPANIPGTITLTGNVVSGNISDYGAGGLAMQVPWNGSANDIIIANNIFVGNIGTGGQDGGVFINMGNDVPLYFIDNTVSGNHATDASAEVGGVYIGNINSRAIYFYNNIVRDNTVASALVDIRFFTYGTRIGFNNNYSVINGTWTESGNNIDVDPQFLLTGYWDDNGTGTDIFDDFWVGGDYHLRGTSPCIDTGFEMPPEMPATDYEGDMRNLDGNNDGIAMPDMGADEYVNSCEWDTDLDADVDGIDIAFLAQGLGSVYDENDAGVLATDFGRVNCSLP